MSLDQFPIPEIKDKMDAINIANALHLFLRLAEQGDERHQIQNNTIVIKQIFSNKNPNKILTDYFSEMRFLTGSEIDLLFLELFKYYNTFEKEFLMELFQFYRVIVRYLGFESETLPQIFAEISKMDGNLTDIGREVVSICN